MIIRRKQKNSEENLFQCHIAGLESHLKSPEIKPGSSG
jgi:hypothetical protein